MKKLVAVQMDTELAGWLEDYAKRRYTTVSAVLRMLVVDLKDKLTANTQATQGNPDGSESVTR